MLFNPKFNNYSFLLLFTFLYNAYATPINKRKTGLEKLHTDHANAEIYAMYGLDLAILQLASLCTLYMIIRTFARWVKHDSSLHMSHKLPFYMAFSEFFIYTALIINLYYPAVNNSQWPEQQCKIIGLIFYYFAIFNMILVGSLAIVAYLRVCKAMKIDTGVLDYKLFIFPIIIPAVLSIPAWKHAGADGYWCFQNRISSFIPLVLLYMNIAILMTSLFCYIGIAHAINVSRFRNDQEKFRTSNKKIIGYLFMYILQWTPVMIYIIIDLERQANMWIFTICIISLPAGGIINTYRYITNEGFWNDKSEESGQDPSSRNDETNLHSIKNFGGPPTVSQWRELSGGDDDVSSQSNRSEHTPRNIRFRTDYSQDSLDIQIQNQSQNRPQNQSLNQSQLSLDKIQPQPSSLLQTSQNLSQDKIDKIQPQPSSSLSQTSQNLSQDKIDKIQLQPLSKSDETTSSQQQSQLEIESKSNESNESISSQQSRN